MRKLSVLLFAAAVGCGESPAPTPTASTDTPAATTAEAGDTEKAAGEVAKRFLRAVLAGDSRSAATLLTTKAARLHAQDPSTLEAMGLDVEQLEVAQALLLDDDEAAVACLITERGTAEPAELCCFLKHETTGWRVCGVASESQDGSPAVISFEGAPESVTEPYGQLVTGGEQPPAERTATAPTDRPVR